MTISSSTLDTDAEPLHSVAIAPHATNYAEEEAKRAERRARRQQRRELKRAAAFALEQAAMLEEGSGEFEGFPGSGSGSGGGGSQLGRRAVGSPPPLVHDDGGVRTEHIPEC